MRWHLRCTFQLVLFGLCTPSRPFIKMFIRKNKNRLHGDHFRITVEPVIVKRYRKTLANRGFYKKKLDTRFDTHCIKTGVQLWRRGRDSFSPEGSVSVGSDLPPAGHSLLTRSNPYNKETEPYTRYGSTSLAERKGFEPLWGCPQTVFKKLHLLPR